jgi:lipopolysaccharide/colanic/teichoic acid biosynthesis glycosyltransferase
MTDKLLRLLDLVFATAILVVASPFLVVVCAMALVTQGRPILYQAPRAARGGGEFRMKKFRTMVVDADKGASSTASTDPRITKLGAFLRRYKLDELPQMLNVIAGEMSLVGPRPQIQWEVDRYDENEKRLLTVRPGITDFASIWFSDEGERLAGQGDPDEAYDRLIRPGKNALALYCVDNRSVGLYLRVLMLMGQAVAGRDVRARIEAITGINADALAR